MRLSRLVLAAAIAAASGAMAFAPQANAADGTITITGKVMNSTCDVAGNGGGSTFTVVLPPVAKSALASSGQTAGDTGFKLQLSNCPATPSGIEVGTQFYSTANANSNGRLANTVTGGATNVVIQLLDSGSNPISVATSQSAAAVTDQTTLTGTSATLDYTARYYATGIATAGNVSTTVEYVINYQ